MNNERELYERLTKSFADMLYSWKHPTSLNDPAIDLVKRQQEIRQYFLSEPMAHHILKALVTTAMREFEWSQMSEPERQRMQAQQQAAIEEALKGEPLWGKGLEEVAALQNQLNPK